MSGKITFTMIKPDAVADGHIGAILGKIAEAGFKFKALKLTQLTVADAKKFYEVHAERPFYGELVEFMSSGPIVAAVLEKDNAVEDFRTLIGATNPADAAEGSLLSLIFVILFLSKISFCYWPQTFWNSAMYFWAGTSQLESTAMSFCASRSHFSGSL